MLDISEDPTSAIKKYNVRSDHVGSAVTVHGIREWNEGLVLASIPGFPISWGAGGNRLCKHAQNSVEFVHCNVNFGTVVPALQSRLASYWEREENESLVIAD